MCRGEGGDIPKQRQKANVCVHIIFQSDTETEEKRRNKGRRKSSQTEEKKMAERGEMA